MSRGLGDLYSLGASLLTPDTPESILQGTQHWHSPISTWLLFHTSLKSSSTVHTWSQFLGDQPCHVKSHPPLCWVLLLKYWCYQGHGCLIGIWVLEEHMHEWDNWPKQLCAKYLHCWDRLWSTGSQCLEHATTFPSPPLKSPMATSIWNAAIAT